MKTIIFGNSGSGKSTLAKRLSQQHNLAHLDLDTIAWLKTTPPQRAPLSTCQVHIENFVRENETWIIEGCYSDLLMVASTHASKMIYLNLPIELCSSNANKRPWEPHKYSTKAEQDSNLPMLLKWIADYETREDTFSHKSHSNLFDEFTGDKIMYKDNDQETD